MGGEGLAPAARRWGCVHEPLSGASGSDEAVACFRGQALHTLNFFRDRLFSRRFWVQEPGSRFHHQPRAKAEYQHFDDLCSRRGAQRAWILPYFQCAVESYPAPDSNELTTAARVESRITSSGFILCREICQSRFSSPALTPSITIFTARFPIASSGCLTVVRDGAAIEDNGTSSKPTTEQSSGTFTPALLSARIAPSAVRSSKAINAVKRFFRCSYSSVNR